MPFVSAGRCGLTAKRCPHCLTVLAGVEKFCPTCHSPLDRTSSDEVSGSDVQPQYIGSVRPGQTPMTTGEVAGTGCLAVGVVGIIIYLACGVFLIVMMALLFNACAQGCEEASKTACQLLLL